MPPVCRHLRTKVLYVPAQAAEGDADPSDGEASRHCWCNKTMTPLGLDDRRVNAELCSDAGRTCYQPGWGDS